MKDFIRKMLSTDIGVPSFLRVMGLPIIFTGLFMLIYGTIEAYDTAVFTGGTVVFLGLTGKLVQKRMEVSASVGVEASASVE